MPLDLDNSYAGTRERTLGQVHRIPPYPNWYKMGTFGMEKNGRYYDCIIVHPKRRDPLYDRGNSLGLDLVREAGARRLCEAVSKEEWPPSDQR